MGGCFVLTRFNKFNFVIPEKEVKIKQSVSTVHWHQLPQCADSPRHNLSGSRNRAKREKFLGFRAQKIPVPHGRGITHVPEFSDIKDGDAYGQIKSIRRSATGHQILLYREIPKVLQMYKDQHHNNLLHW